MSTRTISALLAALIAVIFICLAGTTILVGSSNGGCLAEDSRASTPPSGFPSTGAWDGEQVSNASTITAVGVHAGVPARGWVVAVATAMQESGLRNLPGGDRDSVGLFQQRPSQGWGSAAQLRDPGYAAGKFYGELVTIEGWQSMPLTVAAQAVQRSAYPDAYAKWEADAAVLVNAAIAGTGASSPARVRCWPWTPPVQGAIVSKFRTSDRPGHDGVDLGAPRGTLIRAASTGVVRTMQCTAIDIRDGSAWGCDRDGSPVLTRGCGWYVDIDHEGGIVTRYCHMEKPPLVNVGDHVVVGQPLGVVGSTGNSSGPHLHFEVHLSGDAGAGRPVDPVPFMVRAGAQLGKAA